jgi:hypothetical protein
MRIRRRSFFLSLLAGSLLLPLTQLAAADEWGHKLPGQPTQFVFGYGSLIDAESRAKTAGATTAAIPVRVSSTFGYLRAWVDRCPCGFTALGLRKPRSGESPMTINGVIYPVDETTLRSFDRREANYRRILVPSDMIEAVSWQGMPQAGQIWVYMPVGESGEPAIELSEPSARYPMLQSYIDLVLHGALEYGPDFAREVIATTTGWSAYWLDDREEPRRPWVHSSDYQVIDSLLRQTEPASTHMKDRLFPEEFTAMRLMSPTEAPAEAR